jgi:predicted transcriptional regulator
MNELELLDLQETRHDTHKQYAERRIKVVEAFLALGTINPPLKTFKTLLRHLYEDEMMSCIEISEQIKAISEQTISQKSVERNLKSAGVVMRDKKERFRNAIRRGRVSWQLQEIKDKQPKKQISQKTRYQILQRDGFRCILCGSKEFLEIDHIIPRCSGGTNDLTNLRTLCHDCNIGKRIAHQEAGIGGGFISTK